jgi:hypothetical protein
MRPSGHESTQKKVTMRVSFRAGDVLSAPILRMPAFFTDPARRARIHPLARLDRWRSEQRCAEPGAFGTTLIQCGS